MTRSGTARRLTAAVLALGLFGTLSAAQPPRAGRPLDPIAEAQARQKIADQRAESDVLDAIAAADRLARTNPAKAAQALKAAQTNIDLAVALSGDTRKNLTDQLQRKIAALEGRPLANPGPKADPNAAAVKLDRKAAYESYAAELKDVNDGIQKMSKYKQAGLAKEADQELARLAIKYPNNPSVIRLQEKDTFGSRVDDSLEFARLQEKRITLALNDVQRSSLPAAGDIEFPKDWKEKTKRRAMGVELTAKEKKIIEALDKPMTVSWNGKMLEEALQELSNAIDQNLFIDKKSLSDLGVDLQKGVTLQARGVSARTVLRQLLAAQGLTFVVKEESIQVVTVEKAQKMLVTRVYYLGDVVSGVGPFGGAPNWGTFLDFQQTMANVELIVKAITDSIDPLSWKEHGGPGTVTFHYPSMSIIVRASAEVHATLGTKMGGGR
jgi:hypothetical protein